MVRLASTISRLNSRKILVAGDLMLDTYTIGKARRISPEAPVAIIQVVKEENRPGGAGNVVLNLKSLGAQVSLLGRIGKDLASELLQDALKQENVDLTGLFVQEGFSTPLKNRVIADNQQIVRVDYEQAVPLPEMLEEKIVEMLPKLLEGVDAVAISDYGKGFLSRTLLSALIEQANLKKIPVITDPKGVDFTKYQGTTIIKPNLSEAYAAANMSSEASLDMAAEKVLRAANAQTLLITRSEAGISAFQRGGIRQDFPVRAREIKDVTGAGDTVLAVIAYAIANELSIAEAAQLSNVAAGMAIERFGCARISLSELARRLLENDVVNKVFDDEHLFALQEALKEREYVLFGLSGQDAISHSIFSSIQRLAKHQERDLVIVVSHAEPDSEFVKIMASLHEVKFIILNSIRLANLFEKVPPVEVHGMCANQSRQLTSAAELFSYEKSC